MQYQPQQCLLEDGDIHDSTYTLPLIFSNSLRKYRGYPIPHRRHSSYRQVARCVRVAISNGTSYLSSALWRSLCGSGLRGHTVRVRTHGLVVENELLNDTIQTNTG
eukprot:6208818-Pleurochrysis_carterae.AAC.2